MRRTLRQFMAVLALALAAVASLATSYGPPVVDNDTQDRLSFHDGQRVETRRIEVHLAAGADRAVASAWAWSDAARERGIKVVTLVVTRDSDGKSVGSYVGWDSDDLARFDVFEDCAAGTTCTGSFTFVFTRAPQDTRADLEFDWELSVAASYPDMPREPGSSPPAGSMLTVTITR